MKSVIGLKINYTPSDIGGGYLRLRADVVVSEGVPSKSFITSPQIRSTLAKNKFAVNQEFGHILLEYSIKDRALDWRKYFPIPHEGGRPKPEFLKLGIASRIESRVEKEARVHFPNANKVIHWHPSWLREAQLKNRGFSKWKIFGKVPLKTYANALRGKLAKDIRKKRTLLRTKK